MIDHETKYTISKADLKQSSFEIISAFVERIMLSESVNEIVWCITENAISKLAYHDCVVYLFDEKLNKLVQMSAHGPKQIGSRKIKKPILLSPGEGLVGFVYNSGVGELINDTTKDPRYIKDDELRFSEISIPIIIDEKVVGIIDSEHPKKNYFDDSDFKLLTTIANLTSIKLEKIREHISAKNELETKVHQKTKALISANNELFIQNKEKEILLKEIHHRVKNNMQIIISLLKMQMNITDSEKEYKVFKACADRMFSIAEIHGKLYFENNLLKIPIKEFIYDLGSSLLISYFASEKIKLILDIKVDKLSLDIGIPLGLIVNELLTYSIENNFKEYQNGKIFISLSILNKSYQLIYSDNGISNSNTKNNLISDELIDILVDQLDGTLERSLNDSNRTIITLVFPE